MKDEIIAIVCILNFNNRQNVPTIVQRELRIFIIIY